ncbi:MAG: hypothetical protein ACI9WU_003904 [Myxococcota bacterium]|jgi:hypothetical protein
MSPVRLSTFPLLAMLLLGCPASDDIVQIHDAGLSRLDVTLDSGQPDQPDTPIVQPDTETPDVSTDLGDDGCTRDAQCSGQIEVDACQVPVCEAGDCVPGRAPDDAPCDDGDACTVTACSNGSCVKLSDVECDDGQQCTADVCNPNSGCQFIEALGLECDDGDECTMNDVCNGGLCIGGAPVPACVLGTEENPGDSCRTLQDESFPSGPVWVKAGAGSHKVYCNQDIQGGGWARVARVGGDQPICSLGEEWGDQAQLTADNPQGTVTMPVSVAGGLSFAETEVLIVLDGGSTFRLKSANAQWSWGAVAKGEVNSENVVTYEVQGATHAGQYQPLAYKGGCKAAGACMLAGDHGGANQWAVVLGIGGYATGGFVQNDACLVGTSAQTGLFLGDAAGGTGSWQNAATIYIR